MADHPPQVRRLTLELEPETDPIAGFCNEAGRPAVRFVGWLALMAILERAQADRSDDGRPLK